MNAAAELQMLFGTVREFWSFHREQPRLVRNCVNMALALFFLIVLGSFTGAWSFNLKLYVMDFFIFTAAGFLIFTTWRRAIIGTELATVIGEAKKPGRAGTEQTRTALEGAERFLRLMAAVAASEMTIGFIGIFLPTHRNPGAAILLLLAGFAAMTYAFWIESGIVVWRKIVFWMIIATIALSLGLIFWGSGEEISGITSAAAPGGISSKAVGSRSFEFLTDTWAKLQTAHPIDQAVWMALAIAAPVVGLVWLARQRQKAAAAAATARDAKKPTPVDSFARLFVWCLIVVIGLVALTVYLGALPQFWLWVAILVTVVIAGALGQRWMGELLVGSMIIGILMGVVFIGWVVLVDAHSQEKQFRAGANATVQWLIKQ
ncbi:MAG: hypothetical protein HYT39_03675 [Candidatus Sungbacteria bacterium]|nr:hypothetical protein [Candidatus Sungbacteria bacterium]